MDSVIPQTNDRPTIIHQLYRYIVAARMGVLPREVHFDCAGPVFYEIGDVGHLPQWLTRSAIIVVVVVIII